jgi:hypothetical protein
MVHSSQRVMCVRVPHLSTCNALTSAAACFAVSEDMSIALRTWILVAFFHSPRPPVSTVPSPLSDAERALMA